jgi:DNA-directed RNA polymerase specialized sigma24 family protein
MLSPPKTRTRHAAPVGRLACRRVDAIMPSHESVTHWIGRIQQAHDAEAQQRLWDAYFSRLVTLARSKLKGSQRRVTDEEDVIVSVMDSFFSGAAAGRFHDLKDRDNLWPLLVTITARKVSNQVRAQRTQKRGGGQVRGDSVWTRVDGHDASPGIDQVIGVEPTPEFAVAVAEHCEQMLANLADDGLARIARLKLEGYTNTEIAQQTGAAPRTVERRLEAIRKRWEHLQP